MPLLFLLFLLVPVVEMYVLIRVGAWIGAWPTIGLVVLTAAIGVSLLRQQGLATLSRGLRRMDAGQLPAQEMLEGLVLAVGGALLLTPGFVTDAFGFACLLPVTRRALVRLAIARGSARVATFHGRSGTFEAGPGDPFRRPDMRRGPDGGHIIEGEFERDDRPDP